MKWFDKWFAKKVKHAWDNSRELVESDVPQKISAMGGGRTIDSHGMNFTVYRASGGHIIETRRYDRKRDTNDNGLHIITDDKDLGEEIGKIITYENLRN
jgi:hypothetical protein